MTSTLRSNVHKTLKPEGSNHNESQPTRRPLRLPAALAEGSQQPGSGKGRAMDMISHLNRDGGARRPRIAVMAVLAVMAVGADPVANANPPDFFAAVQAASVNGVGPALLENGYDVCWKIWNGGYTGQKAAAALQQSYPTLTTDQAAHFVLAAYHYLCPTQGAPGEYDWWTYGNGSPG
jgi:Protein of unknown function (DUF732)